MEADCSWEQEASRQRGSSFCPLLLSQSPIQTQLNHTELRGGGGYDLSLSDKATAGDPTSLSDLFFPQQWLG